MFSYYQIHPKSINKINGAPSSEDRVTADVKTNTKSWSPRFTSSFLSGIKTIRKVHPKTPPNGFISLFLVLLTTIEILRILTGIKCHHILNSRNSALSLASEGDNATSILTASEGVADCTSLSSKGDNDLCVSKHKLCSMENFEQDIKYPLCLLQGFTTSFADGNLEKLNKQSHLDTESVFFVCNNPTTGHLQCHLKIHSWICSSNQQMSDYS
jgi:hypothetical protein